MEVLFVLIPVSIVLATASVVACLVAIRSGQFDDVESPRWRMLFDPSGPTSEILGKPKQDDEIEKNVPGKKVKAQ